MERFKPNPNLYTEHLDSFTSDDEFDANRRVHISNEMPPQDLFDLAHSKLKNDYWKWFIGSTSLALSTDGIEYNLDTNGVETFDQEGVIIEPSIAKYMNGIRVKDYGPAPRYVFSPTINAQRLNAKVPLEDVDVGHEYYPYDIVNTNYNRLEIEGTIMPEMDFLLHEGYRYLETLYPDHPDFTEILTNNELNDDIIQSAAIIDYHPNVVFMDWLAAYFEHDDDKNSRIYEYQTKEALKLKIRDLTNNAFRRKFYGAKAGYSMFGSEIFQHIMIYPIAEYMPFLPRRKKNDNSPYSEGHKKFTWFKDIFNAPEQFENHQVNRFDQLYKRPFRLVDWDNSSYDYEHLYEPPTVVYGTAFSTPLSNYDLYEWPIDRDWMDNNGEPLVYAPPSIQNDFYEGQKILIRACDHSSIEPHTEKCYKPVYINAMFSEPIVRVQAKLDYTHDEFLNVGPDIYDYVTRIQIDGPSYPVYSEFDVYRGVKQTLQMILDSNASVRDRYKEENNLVNWTWSKPADVDVFLNSVAPECIWRLQRGLPYYDLKDYEAVFLSNTPYKMLAAIRELYKILPDHKSVKFTLEPHQDGNLFMPAQHSMTLYKNWLNVHVDRTTEPKIVFGPTSMAEHAYVNVGDLITHDLSDTAFVSEVVGQEGGSLKFDIKKAAEVTTKERAAIEKLNTLEFGQYGVVMQFHKNNELWPGRKVVLMGKPTFTFPQDVGINGLSAVEKIYFEIQAIPNVKPHEVMLALYPNYEAICEEKVTQLNALLGIGASIKESTNVYKVYYKRYDDIFKQLDKLYPAFETLLEQNAKGNVHPNDSYWQKVKAPFKEILADYNLSPVRQEQITNFYNAFIANTDRDSTIDNRAKFEANCKEIIATLESYNKDYLSWICDTIAIDLNRDYYLSLENGHLSERHKVALKKIKAQDELLDPYLMNKAYLLKPAQKDIFMMDIDVDLESSYTLLKQQDQFVTMLEFGLDKYGDLIEFSMPKALGTNGVLMDFTFGSLNTASIVNNNIDIDNTEDNLLHHRDAIVPDVYFRSSNYIHDTLSGDNFGSDYVKTYEIEDKKYNLTYNYRVLNEDILKSVANNPNQKKFSYATAMFLELFLPERGLNNLSGEIVPPYEVEIRSFITYNSNIISFVDEESVARFACLSTGDRVIGPGIEDDIFIEYIDVDKKQIKIKKTNLRPDETDFVFKFTDDLVLTYLCRMNTFSKDSSTDFFKYRVELSKNKLIDSGNILVHGLTEQFSNVYLNSVIDVSKFSETVKANLQTQPIYKNYFNRFVRDLHHNFTNVNTHYILPSVINSVNKLFLEIGAYKLYDIYNEAGGQKTDKEWKDMYLMKREILDYFQDALGDLSRGSDVVNIGTNIIASTKNDGSVSKLRNAKFTDPNILLRFATYNWGYTTQPYYIDIGIGALDDFFDRTEEELEEQKRLLQDKSYWNYDVYDDNQPTENISGIIDLDKANRTYWAAQRFEVRDLHDLPDIDHIDKPIMRAYLGEYEVQKLIEFDAYPNKKFTTVQFSIIKQVFKNLEKKNDPLNILNNTFFVNDIFQNIKEYNETLVYHEKDEDITITYFAKNYGTDDLQSDFVNYYYLGDWNITTETEIYEEKSGDNVLYTLPYKKIKYPAKISDQNYVYYYTITDKKEFSDIVVTPKLSFKNNGNSFVLDETGKKIIETETVTFEPGTVIIFSEDKWIYKQFIFTGLLGTQDIKTYMDLTDPEDVNIENSYEAQYKDEFYVQSEGSWNQQTLTIKHRLLLKLITSLGYLQKSACKAFTCEELEEIFRLILGKTDTSVLDALIKNTNLNNYSLPDKVIQQKKKTDQLPTEYKNTYHITKDHIFWFVYTVGSRSTNDSKTDWELMELSGIKNGTILGLVYLNDHFYVTFMNENEFLFKINSNNIGLVNRSEFNTFIGKYGNQKPYLKEGDILERFFLYEKLRTYNNSIQLDYNHLLPGSVNIKFLLKPNFTTDGWDYNEDGSLGEEVSGINLTEENIYYDEPNNKLFTYNTVSGSLEKKAIKQEEHKFFKNLLHIYGEYDLENVLQEDKYVTVPKITSIDGITFNSDGLSLLDRILQVEEINVRSLYNKALEPTFYSSYCNIKGIIQGIYVSGYVENSEVTELNPASGYLSIGYEDREEPVLTSNRLKFSTELQKILPVRTINGVPEQFKESEIHYENAKWLDTNEKIYSPEVKDFTVTRNISNTDTEKLFSYYKNTLVLEGEIDLVTPNYISFAKNSKLQDALSYLRINDTIKDIYAITTPSTEQFIEISSSELNSIKFIDYQQDKFIMANETGYVFTNQYKTIQAIPEGKLNLEPFYPLSGEAAYSYNNLTSLSYDKPNNRWLVALTGQNLDKNYSDIIAIKLDKLDGESRENVVFQNPGIDVNTYDFIKILESFDYRTPQELSKLTSEQLQNYQSIFDNTTSGYVLARDLSIIEAEELEENIIYFSGLVNDNVIKDKFDKIDGTISGCSESDDSKIEALQYFLTSEGNEQKEKDVLSITKDSVDGDSNGIWKSNKIVLNQPSDYKILSLNVSKIKTTNSKATISIGFFENIGQMWIYDKFTEKWTVTTSILSNHDFLVHSNGSDVVHCECYICGWFYNIDEENQLDWGLNIHSLPRAEVSDDTIVCAFILDPIGFNNNLNFTRLKIKIEKNSKEQKKETFMISDIVLKDKKNIPYNSKILEGVYSPTVSNSFIQNRIKKHVGNKWVLNNNNEYQAIVIGSTLFLYSPTNLYDILTKKKSGVSKFFHWKRAELPSVENITYSLFNEMNKKINYLSDGEIRTGLFELWSLVNENYENIVNLNKSNLNSSIIFTSFKTWLLNNKPIFYKTEEEIPLVITHEGLEIIQTEKGKIINLGEKLLHQWNAPQDILVEMGISSLVYLKKQNYIRYLADYYAIILGCKKFKNFFDAGNIKDAKLTENYLYFQTHNDDIITLDLDFTNSREDIENYNNWNFSNIDEHYVINLQADNLYLEKTIGLNGVYETLELIPYLESKKGFTICEKYINKNIHIYVGYILANNFIQNKNLSLMYEYYPNDTKNILLIKYPVIFVSTDNGVNFKRQDLFSGTNKIPKINSYDSSTIESSSNLWFSQIFKVNNELRINLQSQLYSKNEINNNPIENLGYTSYLISEYENDVSILYQNNFEEYSNINEKNDKRLKITRNSKIKNIEVYYTTNNTINVTENSTIGSSVFLKRPFSFNTNNTFISLLDDDGLEFSPSLENKSDDHEQIRVLVSIVPYEMLERPTQYVSYLPEYLNGYGDFAVSSFIEVDNITQANRLYSKRECMTPEVERLVIPKNGIPAIAEDLETGRHVYQYYDPYVNAQGETTYKYIEAKNSAGQIVKLCRLNGDYLTELDSISNTNYFNLRTMITENVEYASLIAAPLLLPDYEATTLNSYFTDILQSIVNKKYIKNTFRGGLDKKVLIQYINFMGVAPQLYLDLFKITNNDIIEYLLEHDETIFGKNVKVSLFYKMPKVSTLIFNDHEFFYRPFYKLDDIVESYHLTENDLHTLEDWVSLRDKYQKFFGPFMQKDGQRITDRFSTILIKCKDKEGNVLDQTVFIDKTTGIIPIKDQDNITVNFYVPHQFNNGQQLYSGYTFKKSEKQILDELEENYPITTLYNPPKGYGGSRNNTSWDEIRPEELDYEVFDYCKDMYPYLTRNNKGEYIYLSNENGVKLVLRNGLDWLNTKEILTVSYNKLFAQKQSVKFWPNIEHVDYEDDVLLDTTEFDYMSYQRRPSEYNFYRLPLTPIDVYTPKQQVNEDDIIGGKVYFNKPSIIDEGKSKVLLTILKLSKAGIEQTLADYTLEFYNSGETDIIPNLEYKDEKVLYTFTDDTNRYPSIDEDLIRVKITNTKIGQTKWFDLHVQPHDVPEVAAVTNATFIKFNDGQFFDTTVINLEFDPLTIDIAANVLESQDQSIILAKNKLVNSNISLTLSGYPQNKYFKLDNENIYLDLRNYHIKSLPVKNWIKAKDEQVAFSLYSGDQLITKSSNDIENEDDSYYVEYKSDNLNATVFKIPVDLHIEDCKDLTEIHIDDYIFTWNSSDIETSKDYTFIKNVDDYSFVTVDSLANIDDTEESKILISGLPGNIIFNYPKYNSFQELLDEKDLVINYKERKILYDYNGRENNKITGIDPGLLYFNLSQKLALSEDTFIKMKVLPIQTIMPEIRYMNNLDYIGEVNIAEKDFFGYDRVSINNNIAMDPPIIYKKRLYNENSSYYTNNWVNKDGFKIYLANDDGKFVEPKLSNSRINFEILDKELNDGDCRPKIYGTVDPRFNLPELVYKTSAEEYKDNYYIKGKEINPFVLVVNIKDEFNLITQQFDQNYEILVARKSENSIEYVPAVNSYANLVHQAPKYEINGTEIVQNEYLNFIDYVNGTLNFTLNGPKNNYQYNEYRYLHGIKYFNQFNIKNGNLKSYWTMKSLIDNKLKMDFMINTYENLVDKKNKDYGTVEITEMGIFDRYDHLCAYITHPKVQYRSDSQHISYSLIIEET